jgi:hypothetical protein
MILVHPLRQFEGEDVSMRDRTMNSLARCALIAAMGAAGATNSVAQDTTQVIPQPALLELLRHVARSDTRPERHNDFSVLTASFPENAMAAEVARSAGFAVYATYDEILQCSDEEQRRCPAVGHRVGAIDRNTLSTTGETIVVRFIVSTVLRKRRGEGVWLSPAVREITLRRSEGRWQVHEDRLLWRS